MKFSEIEHTKWQALKPYLDTVLLPVTGLDGTETPAEATTELEKLRDWLDPIEQQFNGRIVTYPAYHYVSDEMSTDIINRLIENMKKQGFKYVIAASAKQSLTQLKLNVDAVYCPQTENELPIYETASFVVLKMWSPN